MPKGTVVILGSLLVLILIIFFLILPVFDSLNSVRAMIDSSTKELEQEQNLKAKIEQLNEEYNNNPKAVQNLLIAIPEQEDLSGLLTQLENLAMSNGLAMESVDFKEQTAENAAAPPPESSSNEAVFPQAGENTASGTSGELVATPSTASLFYKTLSVDLKLSGSYSALKNYLKAVEKNVRLMDVDSLNLNTASSQPTVGESQFFILIELSVYYY